MTRCAVRPAALLALLALAAPRAARAQMDPAVGSPPQTRPARPGAAARRQAVARLRRSLVADDPAGFRRLVTRRILALHAADFGAWFAIWRDAALRRPDTLASVALAREDSAWKLDEN